MKTGRERHAKLEEEVVTRVKVAVNSDEDKWALNRLFQEEADAIENQRMKDKKTLEIEKSKKMEGGVDKKSSNVGSEPNSKRVLPRASSEHPDDERGTDKRNDVKARNHSFVVAETSSFHLGSSVTVSMFQRVAISTAANMCKKLPSDVTSLGWKLSHY